MNALADHDKVHAHAHAHKKCHAHMYSDMHCPIIQQPSLYII